MAFDYKKEYKEFYLPKNKPSIVTVPPMNYIAVRGKGDPNDPAGDYQAAIGLLYGIAFTIKMSKKGDRQIEGYFDYVVPPLEGFWRQEGVEGVDYAHKEAFEWISVIRLPDFVTKADFDWAVEEATRKKKADFSKVEFLSIEEGLCVQCMHVGPYDDEPATVEKMHEYMLAEGYNLDLSDKRRHHEIYLSDARKTAPEKLKTVIRHPIRKAEATGNDLIAYCGVNCEVCPDYTGNKCPGCRQTDWPKDDECMPVACCRKQDISFCGQCPTFPCPDIQEFYQESDSHKEAFERMNAMQ